MPNKLDIKKQYYADMAKKYIEERGYQLLSEYIRASDKIKIKCPSGHEFEMVFTDFKRSNGCPKCNGFYRSNIQDVIEYLDKIELNLISNKFVRDIDKLDIKCKNGHAFKRSFGEIKRGFVNCPICRNLNSFKSQEGLEAYLNKYDLKLKIGTYKGPYKAATLICKEGHEFNKCFHNIKVYPNCPICRKLSLKRFKEYEITKEVEKRGFKLVHLDYKNYYSKITMECNKGHQFSIDWSNFKQGKACRKCSLTHSTPQEELESLASKYGKIYSNTRKIIKPYELDVYYPEFNFGIEMNGLYWHSDYAKKDSIEININKIKLCQDKNIKFLGIFQDDWDNKKYVIDKMIQYRTMHKKLKKISAHKLEIKVIDKKQAKNFINKNTIEDFIIDFQSILGLFLKDKLIACLTYNKENGITNIIQFVTNPKYIIYGCLSKFLKHLDKPIIIWSDNRFSTGESLFKMGFKLIENSHNLEYWYTDLIKRIWYKNVDYSDRSVIVEDKDISKKYFNHERPIYRIYNYGRKKFMLS